MDEIPVCRMCLETVFYSICTDCLFRDLERWMEEKPSFVQAEVTATHEMLDDAFPESPDNEQFCIRCKEVNEKVICPYCYIREIYHELRMIDEVTAEELVRAFDFDFERNGYFGEMSWDPIDFHEVSLSEGICNLCGNEKVRLYDWHGKFLCVDCLEDEEDYARAGGVVA